MLRGQLSVSFVSRIALGFLMIIALAYATLMLEETIKRESQKQTLIGVSEYVAGKMFGMIHYISPGQSTNQTFRVPISRDYYSGQYSMKLEDIDGVLYVSVQSTKWPYMTARHPMFLNTSHVDIDTDPMFPPIVCASASRNTTHYTLSLYC